MIHNRVADHDQATDAYDGCDQYHEQPQRHSQPFVEALEFEQLQADRALLVQVFGLDLDQAALFDELCGSVFGELGIVPGRLGGQRSRRRVQGCRGLRAGAFSRRLAIRTQQS
jgi:hypothetical protein